MKFTLLALAALFTASVSTAQLTIPSRIEASFSIWSPGGPANPDFPAGLSASFSYTLNLPQAGAFSIAGVTPESLLFSPAQWGGTLFTRHDVGLDLWFQDGIIQGAMLGGLYEGQYNYSFGLSSPVTPSDFALYLFAGSPAFFSYQIDGQRGNFASAFPWSLTVTPLPIGAVPEPSSYGVCGAILALGLIFKRRRAQHSR